MPTPSPRLGLAVPSQSDPFSTADIAANWSKIDAAPGLHICTSTTRPTWGSSQNGRHIFETNTGLMWRWDAPNNRFVRDFGRGMLRRSDNSAAAAFRNTDFSTTSYTAFRRAVTLTNVVVPAGNRPLEIRAFYADADNPLGNFAAAIFRSGSDNSGTVEHQWKVWGGNQGGGSDQNNGFGGGNYMACILPSGLAAATYSWSLQIRSFDGNRGTSRLQGTTASPITLAVVEL